MESADIIIVGGGWAGISAAVQAVERGMTTVLFESAPQLGGRCFSFYDKQFGEWLDNGVHIFIGAYKESLSLLRRWGMEAAVDFKAAQSIHWQDTARRETRLRIGTNRLSAAMGLLSFGALSLKERIATARCALKMGRSGAVEGLNLTVSEYLWQNSIDPKESGGLWEAMCLAVMNAKPEQADVAPLIEAVEEGLLIGGRTGRIGILTKPFQQLLSEPAYCFLQDKGVEVHLRSPVDSLVTGQSRGVGGVQSRGVIHRAGKVILALPPLAVLKLISTTQVEPDWIKSQICWEHSAITTVHLTFEKPVLTHLPLYMQNSDSHWLFGRGERETGGWRRVTTVTSAAPKDKTQNVIRRTLDELHARFPEKASTGLEAVKVIQNQRATLLLRPGSSAHRPVPATPLRNLYLAGDWCATGLPATIEGAARSGRLALESAADGAKD